MKFAEAVTDGGTGFNFSFAEKSDSERTTKKSHHFNAEVGAGYETSETAEDALGFGFNIRVAVNGDYSESTLETEKQTVSAETQIAATASSTSGYGFSTKWFVCSGKDGSVVLDYQTDIPLGGSSNWNAKDVGYHFPDPAFILPWAPYYTKDEDGTIRRALPPAPGLEQFSPEIRIWPAAVKIDDTVTITATVRNFSNQAIEDNPFVVRFCLGEPTCQPGDARYIDEKEIRNLDRNVTGPVPVVTTWTAAGGGEQRIYAIIDPGNAVIKDEIHDENDLINNNIAYGVVTIGAAKYADPGLAAKTGYLAIPYMQDDGPSVTAYVPPGNLKEVVNFVLRDSPLRVSGQVVGRPFELVAVAGQSSTPTPNLQYTLRADDGNNPPAVIAVRGYGASGADMKLYRATQGSSVWQEVTCSTYAVQRVAATDDILVPVCKTGTYVLSATTPTTVTHKAVFLPMIRR